MKTFRGVVFGLLLVAPFWVVAYALFLALSR